MLSQAQCRAQLNHSVNSSDQESAKISLRQYKIDTCLNDLLYAVADADSIHKWYPPKVYYYLLHFEKATKYNSIVIYPMRWSLFLPKDCSAVIQVDNMSFLCCGDFKSSPLFTDMGIDIVNEVSFEKSIDKRDEERDKKLRDWEHSPTALVGLYNVCHDYPINLHVNVGRKLGYVGKENKDRMHD